MSNVECWNCGRTVHFASDCRESWSGDKGSGKSKKPRAKGKDQGKGKLNNVEDSKLARRMVGSRNVKSRTE